MVRYTTARRSASGNGTDNVFIVKTTWGNLNLKGPSAYDSAAEWYRETTGADFSKLTIDEQNSIIRERCKAR